MKNEAHASKYDVSAFPEVDEVLKQLPSMQYKPLVGVHTLREVSKVLQALPELEFPVNSAGELISKLGGSGATFEIVQIEVDPVRMIKYMPAHYFPVANVENLIEKMGELIEQNRRHIDVPAELKNIKRQLDSVLEYPIESKNAFLKMVSGANRNFNFQGRQVVPEKMMDRVPEDIFPIRSEEEFFSKIKTLMVSRELVVPH